MFGGLTMTCYKIHKNYMSSSTISHPHINSKDDCISLQQNLTALEQWLLKWEMLFNPTKCEFLCITNNKSPLIHITT